ncbi:MAG: orotate phosphoribosyltransferase [Acidimicrobiia bacterium]|nr:orotate phosphoribosyltransferase [Acidimicrobiia bacterium]
MDSIELARIFKETGALLTGHFLLTSGLHSEQYLQCARVLQWPHYAEACGRALAVHFAAEKPSVVVSPAIGGIVIGQEVGRALGCRAIFAERENGALRLRRGFSIEAEERAVVVEDVITTGGSTLETMEVVKSHGGRVLGALSVIDRSGGKAALGSRYHSLWTLSVATFKAGDCPLCNTGSLPVKPGSRSFAGP